MRLRDCRFYLGHDRDLHLAAPLGSGLILWGSTDLAVWGLRGAGAGAHFLPALSIFRRTDQN